MGHLNRALIQKIPELSQEKIGYYPDILFYQHDKIQYRRKLQHLAQASYLYTDGYGIKAVGWFRYFIESFKGWFGYTNHCQHEKVQLSLHKFAFYGYLKGYKQSPRNLRTLGLTTDFINLVSQPRTNQNSAAIQQTLIDYYVENEFAMNTEGAGNYPRVSQRYAYGSILQHLGFWSELPDIDPQNDRLIANTLQRLEPEANAPQNYTFISSSKYATAVANNYLERAKQAKNTLLYGWTLLSDSQSQAQLYLERAVLFDSTIALKEKNIYIDYFLEKKNLAKAFEIIAQLDNPEQAIKYIKDGQYSYEQLRQWVIKDSWLASTLSRAYLQNNYNLYFIKLSANFHSNFAELYPVHAFRLKVSQNRFDEAYELFAQNKTQAFLADDIRQLSEHFNMVGKKAYEEGHPHRLSKSWGIAKEFYLKSAAAKRKAYKLQPEDDLIREHYFTHKRLYAQLLIQSDMHSNSAENCKITEIMKAINYLDKCQPRNSQEQKFQKKALIQGLMRQVDYLMTLILTPLGYNDSEVEAEHKEKHQENFKLLTTSLKRIINLLANINTGFKLFGNEDENHVELKLILGKAYFLLADLSQFFQLPDHEHYKQYYAKASETVPQNPFYLIRKSEVEDSPTVRKQGSDALKNSGLNASHYLHWFDERWQRDYRAAEIQDIHYQQYEDKVIGFGLKP